MKMVKCDVGKKCEVKVITLKLSASLLFCEFVKEIVNLFVLKLSELNAAAFNILGTEIKIQLQQVRPHKLKMNL